MMLDMSDNNLGRVHATGVGDPCAGECSQVVHAFRSGAVWRSRAVGHDFQGPTAHQEISNEKDCS
jgi:hypothetical protein